MPYLIPAIVYGMWWLATHKGQTGMQADIDRRQRLISVMLNSTNPVELRMAANELDDMGERTSAEALRQRAANIEAQATAVAAQATEGFGVLMRAW